MRLSSTPLLDWLRATGATKVAIHFDVDTIDADEIDERRHVLHTGEPSPKMVPARHLLGLVSDAQAAG
jgi:hypothetical protein